MLNVPGVCAVLVPKLNAVLVAAGAPKDNPPVDAGAVYAGVDAPPKFKANVA